MDLELALQHRAQVEEFRRKHRTGLVTLVFTDIAGSTQLKAALGDREGVALIQSHHALIRDMLKQFAEAEEISTAGDSFFIVFLKPSDAVRFSLLLQSRLRGLPQGSPQLLKDRVGIHIGEVVIEEREGMPRPKDLYGMQVDLCARVMALAEGDQILLTRSAFDNARQVLKGEDVPGLEPLSWLNHGAYVLAGLEDPVEICEVGESGQAILKSPSNIAKAQRKISADEEPVLGWRPAVGQIVPNTQWALEQKLGEGGFGEVWLGRHQIMKERRVFKFCFRADRVRSLKREMTLFRLIKERIGDHPNIVSLREVYFDAPPFYVEEDYFAGCDLRTWCEAQGGSGKVPLETKFEIVAQIADALQAAHDAGVIHRDVKPANILVTTATSAGESSIGHQPCAKLTDFGIGQVVTAEALAGVTKAGFTQTMLGSTSSQTGTQLYMAPELLAGKPASTRSDIYSLGVVLYQLLANDLTRPLTTDWSAEISDALVREDLQRCFAGNPSDRFAGAGQLARNLRTLPARQRAFAEQQAEIAAHARAAYRRGVIRTASVAAVIVLAIATLAIWAIGAQRKARELAETRRHELYVAQVGLAQQAWEEGNLERAQTLLAAQRPLPNQADLRGFEWRYLWRLSQDESRLTFATLAKRPQRLAFSPDGRTLAIASGNTVSLWDFTGRRELARLEEPTAGISSLAFSPTQPHHVAVAAGQTIRLWDVTTRNVIAAFTNTQVIVNDIAFSPDGKALAAANADGRIALWNLTTQRLAWSVPGHEDDYGGRRVPEPALSVAFSPDGKLLASGGGDTKVRLWNAGSGEQLGPPLDGHTAFVRWVEFSPDGRLLATASNDARVLLWDIATHRAGPPLLGHKGGVLAIAFSPDGSILASAGEDYTIRLWSVAARTQVDFLRGHKSVVGSLAFSRDGQSLVSASYDQTVKVWDAVPRSENNALTSQAGWVEAAALSPDGNTLATADYHTLTVNLWEVASRRLITNFTGHTGLPRRLAFSPDGRLLASGGDDGTVRLWDLKELTAIATNQCGFAVSSLSFSSEGKVIAAAGDGLRFWQVSTWREIPVLKGDTRNIKAVAFAGSGTLLATSYKDGTVTVWDANDGKEWTSFKDDTSWVERLAFSGDGRFIALSKNDGSVTLFDVPRQMKLSRLKGHTAYVSGIQFTPDSKTLASSSGDGTVKLWNLATGQPAVTIKQVGAINAVSFSTNGNLMATCGADGTSRLWPAATLEEADGVTLALVAQQREQTLAAERERALRAGDPGAIKQWLVLLPIAFKHGDAVRALREEQVARESQLRPRAGERTSVGSGERAWRAVQLKDNLLDFNQVADVPAEFSVAYAVTYIESKKAHRDVLLKVGSDDQAKIYLNGKLIYQCADARSYIRDQDTVAGLQLRAGMNVVVFKVVNGVRDWQGSISFTDAAGQPLQGIRATLAAP